MLNNNGAGTKLKSSSGKEYTVVGTAINGRKIVRDASGKIEVMSHDNKILNKKFVIKSNKDFQIRNNSKTSQDITLQLMNKQLKSAQQAFDKQMAEDGWAGDLADGISVLWASNNRACKVEKDLKTYNKNISELQKAAKKGDSAFNAKFKQIYGKDYDQNAIADYVKNPSQKNYVKAFGTKNNIQERVAKYNESQQTGAAAVKTGATVAAGVAIGVATGGAGLVALGTAAAATAASSAAINASDRLSSEAGLKDGEMKQILKNAAWDGASVLAGGAVGKVAQAAVKGTNLGANIARGAINVAGDVGVGAAQEYVETGEVSATGVLTNAALSGVGSAVTSGALKGGKKIAQKLSGNKSAASSQPTTIYNENNEIVAGGLFGKSKNKTVKLSEDAGWQNFTTNDGEITLSNSGDKVWFAKVGNASSTRAIKLSAGEAKILGKTNDGLDIMLERGIDGKYSITYNGNSSKPSPSLKERLFGSSQPKEAKSVQGQASKNAALITDLGDNVDLNNISKHIKSGEVCSVGNGTKQKLYVNNNGVAQEIKLSKEKFDELFPEKGFDKIQQNGSYNCWLVARLNSMIESSVGRAQLYSMFEESADGSILIHLNNSTPTRFPKGKPVKAPDTLLGEGASPGIEMIHQAVLAKQLKEAENQVSDISKLNLKALNNEANELRHSDMDARKYLFWKSKKEELRAGYQNFDQKLTNILTTFKPGKDMAVLTWGRGVNHARTLVNYNPSTQTITYHDPFSAGVNSEISLSDLKQNLNSIDVIKAEPPVNTGTSTSATAQSSVEKVKTTEPQQEQAPATRSKAAPSSSAKFGHSIPEGFKIKELSKDGNTCIVDINNPGRVYVEGPKGWIMRL